MTTSLRLTVCLNVLAIVVSPAEGFGARLEPFSAHHGGYSSRSGSSFQVFQSNRNAEEQGIEMASTGTILDSFDFPPAAYENLNDFVVAYSDGLADGSFSHLQEKADQLAYETFAENSSILDTLDDCGEDCEECLIPEEWKKVPTMMESVDVMEFLGINRVKPLKTPVDAVSKDARR